jgi:hypothetical protein
LTFPPALIILLLSLFADTTHALAVIRSGAGRSFSPSKSIAKQSMVMVSQFRKVFFLFVLAKTLTICCIKITATASLKNVDLPSLQKMDMMESYFLAETLKYLYLLFDPDSEIDLLNKVRSFF